jgi:hypothetical protein
MTTVIGKELFNNQPFTSVTAGGTTTSDTSWTVSSSSAFPAANSSLIPPTYFYIQDPNVPQEIIQVTNISGTTWTVVRGASNSTAAAHYNPFTVYQVISAETLQNFRQTTGGATSAVTVNSSTLTVVSSFQPTSDELGAGASFEAYAYGVFTTNNATAATRAVTWSVYWGGSGTIGSTYTAGTALCMIKTGTNATALTTTSVAGSSFDVNAVVTLLSATTASCNMNLYSTNSSNSLSATQFSATATNATTGGASSSTAVTISGNGPIFLVASWGGSGPTLTATAPLIYRAA